MSYIIIQNITKSYLAKGNAIKKDPVLNGISLTIEKGEFITIFGPNGCGKTTFLNIIAGLVDYDSGSIQINGKSPKFVNIGYIFQNFSDSLFPWRTNLDNLVFPLELKGFPRPHRYQKVQEFLKTLDIEIPLNKFPYQLSVGQQQLLAIVRAFLYEPELLLMDEPFGALDYTTRLHLENKLLEIWEKRKVTVFFVSHDLEEGIYLGDRLILLSQKPARVVDIIENTLPRPRTIEMLESAEFFTLKSKALKIFKREIEK